MHKPAYKAYIKHVNYMFIEDILLQITQPGPDDSVFYSFVQNIGKA